LNQVALAFWTWSNNTPSARMPRRIMLGGGL